MLPQGSQSSFKREGGGGVGEGEEVFSLATRMTLSSVFWELPPPPPADMTKGILCLFK